MNELSPAEISTMAAKAVPDLQRLVDDCNDFQHGRNLAAGHAYLFLPDENETLKIFGILQPRVLRAIKWDKHGFKVTDVAAARLDNMHIPARISSGQVVKPDGLTPETITKKFLEITRDTTYHEALPALAGWDKKEYVPLVMGHPALKISDKLGVYLGVLQIGTHLTVYTMEGESVTNICVQRRSESTSYPLMFDQTAAGGLQYGETPRVGLGREAREEFSEALQQRSMSADHDGEIFFSMIRTSDAGTLADSLEISAKVCYSIKADSLNDITTPKKKNHAVKAFIWMTVKEVLDALKEKSFKPNCALVMIKFLIDKGVIKKGGVGVQKLYDSLRPGVFLDVPQDIKEYGPPKSQASGRPS